MLANFDDHDHQERADLTYGGQSELCQQLLEGDLGFSEHSISRNWTVEED